MDLEWRFTKDGPPFFLLGPAVIEDNASKGVTITRTNPETGISTSELITTSHPKDPESGVFVSNLMTTLGLGEWCQIMNPRGQDKITWPEITEPEI